MREIFNFLETQIRHHLLQIRQHEREIREYENQAAANPLAGNAFVNYHWAKNMLPLLIDRKSQCLIEPDKHELMLLDEYEEKLAPEKENYST